MDVRAGQAAVTRTAARRSKKVGNNSQGSELPVCSKCRNLSCAALLHYRCGFGQKARDAIRGGHLLSDGLLREDELRYYRSR